MEYMKNLQYIDKKFCRIIILHYLCGIKTNNRNKQIWKQD